MPCLIRSAFRCSYPRKYGRRQQFYDFRVNGRRYRASTETADKQQAKKIEARERSRILEGRHGIRRQADVTFREFAKTYMKDHANVNKRCPERDSEILARLLPVFGALVLHEITAHRIEQWKRERLAGRWRAHGQTGAHEALKPATVNRELDTLKSILSKAVEWGNLLESPARHVKRLKVENRRTRILTEAEEAALLAAAPGKVRAFVGLALITGARAGELLDLTWANVRERRDRVPRDEERPDAADPAERRRWTRSSRRCRDGDAYVFTNPRTRKPYTVNGVAHVVRRAYQRADITLGDVTLHTLRHTALSRMIAAGADDLHGDGDLRALVDADARAVHASDDAGEARGARVREPWAQSGHNRRRRRAYARKARQ